MANQNAYIAEEQITVASWCLI